MPEEGGALGEDRRVQAATAWTQAFLNEKGVRYQLGYYSKLSFLKDHAHEVMAK